MIARIELSDHHDLDGDAQQEDRRYRQQCAQNERVR